MNLGTIRGEEWKSWEDADFASRDLPPLEAAICAQRQSEEAFEKLHVILHRARHREKKDVTNQLILRDLAAQAGLDVAKWEEDMMSGVARPVIGKEHEEAVNEWGVFGVPSLLFDGDNPLFIKLEEGDWEGKDDEGLFDAILPASVERPYVLELKTPESAKRAETSRKKYQKLGMLK